MFGNDKKNSPLSPSGSVTLISKHTSFTGDLHFDAGNVQIAIEGNVTGTIRAEPECKTEVLIVGAAVVRGEVRAPKVSIDATVEGDIICSEHLKLYSKARITGNIFYRVLEMAAGAQISGQIRRIDEGTVIDAKPISSTVQATPSPSKDAPAPALLLDGHPDSRLSAKVEPNKESNVEAVVTPSPDKQGHKKRDK